MLVAISPSGRPWSAGLAATYFGETPSGADFVSTLTVAQLGLGGELLTGWVFAALPVIGAALGLILYGKVLQGWWAGWRASGPRYRAG